MINLQSEILNTITTLAPTVGTIIKEVIGSKNMNKLSNTDRVDNKSQMQLSTPIVEDDKKNINFIFNINIYMTPSNGEAYVKEEYEY